MNEESHARRTFEITAGANAKLKDLPKKLGITQPEFISLLIEHAREDDAWLQSAAASIRDKKAKLKETQKRLSKALAGKSEEEIARILGE